MWTLLEHFVGVHAHGAQFEGAEFSFESHHATAIDDGPAIVDFDKQRSQNDDRRKQDQQEKGAEYVQSALDGALPEADGRACVTFLQSKSLSSGRGQNKTPVQNRVTTTPPRAKAARVGDPGVVGSSGHRKHNL